MDLAERQDTLAGRHPWELARAGFFLGVLRESGALDSGRAWLDVGAGDAWFARRLLALLTPDARITCWDENYTADDLEALRDVDERLRVVAARPEERFDRMLMLDVLEHVEDDRAFLGEAVGRLLTEDGLLLLSVPAYARLFSAHDAMLGHRRRYSPSDCLRLLGACGLEVRMSGGLFLSLLPLRFAAVVAERGGVWRRKPRGIGGWHGGAVLTRLLGGALAADARVSHALAKRGRSLPGLSYWALCSRASA
jgi:SAM-dependent methyltransferase